MAPIEGQILRGLPPQLKTGLGLMLFHTTWSFLLGEVTQNYSSVDRVWTFLTPIYSAYFALYPLFESAPLGLKAQGVQPRALIMLALQLIWSARLSYHANRRGFFSLNAEDYRWIVFRDFIGKYPYGRFVLFIFNLGFIAIAQNILLFILSIPTYAVSVSTEPLHYGDALLSGLVLITLGLEFTADNQQYAYQNFKRRNALRDDEQWPGSNISFTTADVRRGFITKGLWAYSRHPNCAAEQTVWLLMSLFPTLTNRSLIKNPVDLLAMLTPAILLGLLFLASTHFTEAITNSKYPLYKQYKKRVAMFWPLENVVKWLWLMALGKRSSVDEAVWGESVAPHALIEDSKTK